MDGDSRIRAADYAHSPVHHAVALADAARLSRLISSLPRLAHPSEILTESDARLQDRLAEIVSSTLDRRDVPRRDTPLHLAVRLDLYSSVAALACAGADPSLQNAAGWTPLQEALCRRRRRIAAVLLRAHRVSAWRKLRRRIPPLILELRELPDFHLELSVRLESPLLPFLSPSDSIRFWKRSSDLRADTSLASAILSGRLRRSPLSFLFLTSTSSPKFSNAPKSLPFGSLLVLDRSRKEVRDAFDGADAEDSDSIDMNDASACRPGVDVTAAELVGRTNWRRREKTEMVGQWKARVYELHNVTFSFKTMKAVAEECNEEFSLEFTETEEDDDFIVAELPAMPPRHSCYVPGDLMRGGDATGPRRSLDSSQKEVGRVVVGKSKEKEMVKSLRPTVWLTEDFPLRVEEFLPLLDILATKVKAVRRLRELLTSKFPPGTFPVKIAIPILPAVRVVFTVTKFAHLKSTEEFFTPPTSPRQLSSHDEEVQQELDNDHSKAGTESQRNFWMRWKNNVGSKSSAPRSRAASSSQVADHVDPFSIPSDFVWVSNDHKRQFPRKSKCPKGKTGK